MLNLGIAFAYALIVYALDRYGKRTKRLLLGVFLWDVVVATIGAILTEALFDVGALDWKRIDLGRRPSCTLHQTFEMIRIRLDC